MSQWGKRGDNRDQRQMRNEYSEVLLEIGEWTLLRRNDTDTGENAYRAMIGHTCRMQKTPMIRNGEKWPTCKWCYEPIPNEIWGLWQLMCNDQRQGGDDGR